MDAQALGPYMSWALHVASISHLVLPGPSMQYGVGTVAMILCAMLSSWYEEVLIMLFFEGRISRFLICYQFLKRNWFLSILRVPVAPAEQIDLATS